MVDKKYLKTLIPRGYGKIIAKRAGVTPKSVSNYLTGRTESLNIETAALEVVSELKKQRSKLIKSAYE